VVLGARERIPGGQEGVLAGIYAGPGSPAGEVARFKAAEDGMRAELARPPAGGKRIVAEYCGHRVHMEQPG
jgi:hypothetical protein